MWIPRTVVLPFRGRDVYRFHQIADTQLGGNVSDEDMLRGEIEDVLAYKHSVWDWLGDIEDEDRPTTRTRRRSANADRPEVNRRDAEKHMAWIDQKVIPLLAPLVHRPCLGILAGHHWTYITQTRTSVQYIVWKLNEISKKENGYRIPYLGIMQAWARVRFEGRGRLKSEKIRRLFHLEHGVGGSQAVGSALKKLEKRSKGLHADVYTRGHDLKLEAAKIDTLESSGENEQSRIYHRTKLLVNTGGSSRAMSLTKGEPVYPEAGGMGPTTMGWARVNAYLRPYRAWERHRDGGKWTCDLKGEI